jgi:hypothetical protein
MGLVDHFVRDQDLKKIIDKVEYMKHKRVGRRPQIVHASKPASLQVLL